MNYQSSAIKCIITTATTTTTTTTIVSRPIHDFPLNLIDLMLLMNRLKYSYSYCTLPSLGNFCNRVYG